MDTPHSTSGNTTANTFDEKFDDEHYPAYTMGRAADMLATTPGFLRNLDELGLLNPQRSAGGHRRYSRHQLRLAARVRELVDQGTALAAACRIVTLENQLDEARRAHIQTPSTRHPPASNRRRRSTNDDADHAPATDQGTL